MERIALKAVVFDMDGTLVDSLARVPDAYVRTIRELGGPPVTREEVMATWHIGPAPVVLEHYLGHRPRPGELDAYFRHLEAAVSGIRPFPGIESLLRALRERGLALGVYTTAMRRAAGLTLSQAGLAGFFGTVVGGDEVTRPKPSGEGLLAACQALGVRPKESLFVGDSPGDVGCAKDAGAHPVQALWAPHVDRVQGEHREAKTPLDVLRAVDEDTAG